MEELISCLRDADCGAELISEACRLYESGERAILIARLRRRRCDLMDEMHESQRKVDCLDFLLQKISKTTLI